ncbi:FAD binding domain-containing protein [Xylogone sp. PMI_703]|nr:FAD binding domain-containing protein [Xylogone sp. PMI_703]
MKDIREFDVIVVGGGNAALVAALTAHEQGVKVAVLEAADKKERGGNSRFAGAIFRIPHNGLEDIRPLLCTEALAKTSRVTMRPYTSEEYTADMMKTSKGRADPVLTKVLMDKSYETVKWMKEKGVHWQLTLNKFFAEDKIDKNMLDVPPSVGMMAVHEGVGLMKDLWRAVENTTITVFYETPACDLIMEGNKVLGVKARQANANVNFYGQVILGCGGFEANPRLRRQFLGEGWDLVVVRGTRFNQGTMLEKAIAAGAQSCGHWGGAHATPQDQDAPRVGDLKWTDKMSRYSYPFGISVNIHGKRFMDEGEEHFSLTYAKTGAAVGQQPDAKAYQIFDQKHLNLLEPRYSTGTPVVADTLEELAKKLCINVANFVQTVKEYNEACTMKYPFDPMHLDGNSTGDKLTIPKSNWADPIDQGPFVAYKVTVGITFTYGGLKTDASSQVLDNEGRPMPGLWACGEMQGGLFYHNYPGGAGLTRGAVFGRIAGKLAASRARATPSARL